MSANKPAAPETSDDHLAPLGSYVLRVRGRPAVLVFELVDVRTGRRRRFLSMERLANFLRRHGLGPLPGSSDEAAGR